MYAHTGCELNPQIIVAFERYNVSFMQCISENILQIKVRICGIKYSFTNVMYRNVYINENKKGLS
jgi:hypothetical protein